MNLFLPIPLTTYVLEFQSPQHHHYIFISMMWISIKIIVIIAIKGIDSRPTVLIIILAMATPYESVDCPRHCFWSWNGCVVLTPLKLKSFLQKVCMCMMRAQKRVNFREVLNSQKCFVSNSRRFAKIVEYGVPSLQFLQKIISRMKL